MKRWVVVCINPQRKSLFHSRHPSPPFPAKKAGQGRRKGDNTCFMARIVQVSPEQTFLFFVTLHRRRKKQCFHYPSPPSGPRQNVRGRQDRANRLRPLWGLLRKIEYLILDSGFLILITWYWILVSGYLILDSWNWLLDTGYLILVTGYWRLNTVYWILFTGDWRLPTTHYN